MKKKIGTKTMVVRKSENHVDTTQTNNNRLLSIEFR